NLPPPAGEGAVRRGGSLSLLPPPQAGEGWGGAHQVAVGLDCVAPACPHPNLPTREGRNARPWGKGQCVAAVACHRSLPRKRGRAGGGRIGPLLVWIAPPRPPPTPPSPPGRGARPAGGGGGSASGG